jgi:hypothetical protein
MPVHARCYWCGLFGGRDGQVNTNRFCAWGAGSRNIVAALVVARASFAIAVAVMLLVAFVLSLVALLALARAMRLTATPRSAPSSWAGVEPPRHLPRNANTKGVPMAPGMSMWCSLRDVRRRPGDRAIEHRMSHTTCVLLSSILGVKTTVVAYKGTGPALNDLLVALAALGGILFARTPGCERSDSSANPLMQNCSLKRAGMVRRLSDCSFGCRGPQRSANPLLLDSCARPATLFCLEHWDCGAVERKYRAALITRKFHVSIASRPPAAGACIGGPALAARPSRRSASAPRDLRCVAADASSPRGSAFPEAENGFGHSSQRREIPSAGLSLLDLWMSTSRTGAVYDH